MRPAPRSGARRHPLANTVVAGVIVALVPLLAAASANAYTYPRFQPASIAFADTQHGVLGEDDWVCQKAHGCEGRLLATSDGGGTWHVTYVGARGTHLYPVRGTDVVYAVTGDAVLKSTDAGEHWRQVAWSPSVVSFVTALVGWRIGAVIASARPQTPPLEETFDGGRSWTSHSNPCRGDYGLTAAISFATAFRGWVVCSTQATAGYQGKEVWQTINGGARWTLQGRTHPIAPPEPTLQIGNLPGFGYPIGATFLPDGQGLLLQDRGYMLITADGGRTWKPLYITQLDTVTGTSADLVTDKVGFALLRGCTVRLVRTTDGSKSWTTLSRWKSPTPCWAERW